MFKVYGFILSVFTCYWEKTVKQIHDKYYDSNDKGANSSPWLTPEVG